MYTTPKTEPKQTSHDGTVG